MTAAGAYIYAICFFFILLVLPFTGEAHLNRHHLSSDHHGAFPEHLAGLFSSSRLITADEPPQSERHKRSAMMNSRDYRGEEVYNRLPGNVVPRHYTVRFSPDVLQDADTSPTSSTLRSWVTMELVCLRSTNNIIMNALGLDLSSTDIKVTSQRRLTYNAPRVTAVEQDWKTQRLVIRLSRPCYKQEELRLSLYNIQATVAQGDPDTIFGPTFHRYTDRHDRSKIMFMTLFEPVWARTAFPCFDEPLYKATFDISVIHPPRFTPLSNMPVRIQSLHPGAMMLTEFERTPHMSTYMLEMLLTEDHIYVNRTWKNKQIRVYAPKEDMKNVVYAVDMLPRILDIMGNNTGIEYSMPKLDLVWASPYTWTMEHWGVITVKPNDLRFDADTDISYGRLYNAHVIIHEMIHQWYGNMVTCDWWDDVFVNEGVTSYLMSQMLEDMNPHWDVAGYRLFTMMYSGVFQSDSTFQSRPLHGNLVDARLQPANVFKLVFTNQLYQKGPTLLLMLEDIIGKTGVQKAMKIFLQRHQYGAATDDQLWEAFTQVTSSDNISGSDGAPLDVPTLMRPWMDMAGYPLVSVSYTSPGKADVTQQSVIQEAPDDRWTFPLKYLSCSNGLSQEKIVWMTSESESLMLEFGAQDADWLLLNPGRTGYYRVVYDDVMMRRIGQALYKNATVIDNKVRSMFLWDILQIKCQGLLFDECEGMREVLSYVKTQERNALVWFTLLGQLRNMETPQEYKTELIDEVYYEVGWEPRETENEDERFLRSVVLAGACAAGHDHCTATAVDLLRQWVLYDRRPPADVVPAIICAEQSGVHMPSKLVNSIKEQVKSNIAFILMFVIC